MPQNYNLSLILAAGLSTIAAALHIAIVIGGPAWYRYFGAGEQFATAAENRQRWPAIITLGIACLLGLWAVYALSGAGVIRPLPFLKLALVIITSVYLLRGLVLVPALLFARSRVTPFVFWSSVICIVYGVFHLLGLVQIWSRLSSIHGA